MLSNILLFILYPEIFFFFNNTKYSIIFHFYIIPRKNFFFNNTKYSIVYHFLYCTQKKIFFIFNFLTIPVVREKIKVRLALPIPTGAATILVNKIIATLLLVYCMILFD